MQYDSAVQEQMQVKIKIWIMYRLQVIVLFNIASPTIKLLLH